MPGIEDWVNNPLAIVQRLYEENPSDHAEKIKEYFEPRIERARNCGQFRGMIQDMYDPEFYLGAYEVENLKTGQKYLRSGKYRDLADCAPQEEIKLDSSRNVTLDRLTYYCVPPPGENLWVKEEFAKQNGSSSQPAASTSKSPDRCKRALEEETETSNGNSHGESPDGQQGEEKESMDTEVSSTGENKKSKTETGKGDLKVDQVDLNFPLPGETGPACIVKLYQSEDSAKLNDVVEIVGILSNDPAMASFPESKGPEKSAYVDPNAELMEGLEDDLSQSKLPPPSLVPRLHAIMVRPVTHGNPLAQDTTVQERCLSEASELRSRLLAVLQKLLFGDSLVAEYLLCHLVSSVYARQNVVAVGKYALNISGCPRAGSLPKLLHGFVKELVTKSHYMEMSLDNMNKSRFTPLKDYQNNRLRSGLLQLSDHTHLVVNETALEQGQLDANGVSNMVALGNLITWQRQDYDFNFHKQEFNTNVITLVMSEGRSLLKCDCQVPLVASRGGFPDDLQGHFLSVLAEDLDNRETMDKLRAYVSVVRQLEYTVPEGLQKEIEEDFVNIRKDDQSKMSVDDFHSLLILARLISLTHGQKELTREFWERAKVLEVERKTRLVLTSTGNSTN